MFIGIWEDYMSIPFPPYPVPVRYNCEKVDSTKSSYCAFQAKLIRPTLLL